jgi:hypothetical protein
MARLLLFFVHADDSTGGAAVAVGPLVQLLLVALVVVAVVVSLCTSSTHAKLWRQSGTDAPVVKAAADSGNRGVTSRKHMLAASLSGIGGKAARMVSWNRRSPAPSGGSSDEEEAPVEDEEAVWRKAIIMGEKCRPLQFSGHIAFDSDGNQLPPAVKKATDGVAAEK